MFIQANELKCVRGGEGFSTPTKGAHGRARRSSVPSLHYLRTQQMKIIHLALRKTLILHPGNALRKRTFSALAVPCNSLMTEFTSSLC